MAVQHRIKRLNILMVLMCAAALQMEGSAPATSWGLPLQGEEAEAFLRSAQVVSVRPLKSKAVTRPKMVELSDGALTWSAVFKTVDEYQPVKRFDNGEVELKFTDSFEYEIAAYELATRLEPWLTGKQIQALWVRRGLILDLADRRVAEQGEAAVLFD